MAGGRFLRSLVPGAFILAAITTAVHRIDAASSNIEAQGCVAKLKTCLDDETCWSCMSKYDQTEHEQCREAARTAMHSSGTSLNCNYFDITPCCRDDASEHACMENGAFVEYWKCHIQSLVPSNCHFHELSCSDIGSLASESNSRAASTTSKPSSVGATRLARMMAGGGLLGFLVSGIHVLTTIPVVQRTDPVSSKEDARGCVAKLLACLDDDVCWSCETKYRSPEYEQCKEAASNAMNAAGTSSRCHLCDVFQCCKDDVSEHTCMENDVFVEYSECHVQSVSPSDCPIRDLWCGDIGSSTDENNSRAASTKKPSSVVFAFVLSLVPALLRALEA